LIRDYRFSEKIKTPLLELCECQNNHDFGAEIKEYILIKSILLELCKYVHSHRAAGDMERVSKKTGSLVSCVLDYIDGNLEKPLTLDELESVAFTSKYYLSRIFKEETNSTIHQYILKKRLLLSKKYIEQGLPVNEVYLKCGFMDYSNFFRAFKQEYGITPKQYLSLVTR
ncbi:MAG: AraC family transcriptional regulator, partial [Clostridia bacterium]|nr:AraC family transcriptional regulator [Clostridia bacterium]